MKIKFNFKKLLTLNIFLFSSIVLFNSSNIYAGPMGSQHSSTRGEVCLLSEVPKDSVVIRITAIRGCPSSLPRYGYVYNIPYDAMYMCAVSSVPAGFTVQYKSKTNNCKGTSYRIKKI